MFCHLSVRNNRRPNFRGGRDDVGWTEKGPELDFDGQTGNANSKRPVELETSLFCFP